MILRNDSADKSDKCIIGIDAHSPRDISDDDSNSLAVRFAKKHNLNLIDRLEFKGRNKK